MTAEDICNVEPIGVDELLATLSAMRVMDLIDDGDLDARFTLADGGTPWTATSKS